jgi:adenosine kinase
MFNGEELTHFIELATYVAVNDYEAELLTERTGLSLQQIAERVSALIVTRGEQGAEIFTSDGRLDIPVVKVADIVDPTAAIIFPYSTNASTIFSFSYVLFSNAIAKQLT